jgi:hypothetical protein
MQTNPVSKSITALVLLIGAIASPSVNSAQQQDCSYLLYLGDCPSLTPTTGGCANNCRSYYTYTAAPKFTAINGEGGPLKDCQAIQAAIPYTYYISQGQNCATLTAQCAYISIQLNAPCDNVSCTDFCD